MKGLVLNLSPVAISYFLHLIATVIWLGGMALLVLVIWPLAERQSASSDNASLLNAIEKRFRPLANLSLLVLLMTGVVQTAEDEQYGGLLDFSNGWSQAMLAKHIAFFGMVGIVAFLQFGLSPALERTRLLAKKNLGAGDVAALTRRERRLTQINFGLGLVVLFFTAIATAF